MKTWMTMTLAAMMVVAIPACTAQTDSGEPDEGAESTADKDTGGSAEGAADEHTGESAAASGLTKYCTTSGSADSGWTYSGIPSLLDFGRSRITWSGSSVNGVGTLTVTGTIDGVTYGPLPNTIALTGAVHVNGSNVGSVSVVDRDGNNNASVSRTFSNVFWSGTGSTTTVMLKDSASGARFEFIRGTANDQFYGLTSGSSTNNCWWG